MSFIKGDFSNKNWSSTRLYFPKFPSYSLRLLFSTFTIFTLAFLITFISFSVFSPVDSSDAATINTNILSSGYKINIKSHDVSFDLDASPTGNIGFSKDTIITNTNSPSGYKLYLSMENSKDCNKTTGLCDGTGTGDNFVPGNALYQDGDSTSGIFISPTAGTLSVPDTLALNSWGVSTEEVTTGNEATFWAVPLLSNPQLIQTTSSANTSMDEADGTKKDVYFGTKVNFAKPSGSYSNTVVYTAAANASVTGDNLFTISPTMATTLTGGEEVTIITTLYTNYTLDTNDVSITIGDNTCTPTSVYVDSATSTVAIKCTTPASSTYGYKDVVANIPKFDWNYTLVNGYSYGDFWSITYMQDMTPGICDTVFTPSNVTGSSVQLKETREAYTATADGTAQVAQRTLYDYRGIDGTGTRENPKTDAAYIVRKLADDNCWMTSNLRLNLSTSVTLTSQSTNISSDIAPTNNTQTAVGTAWDSTSWRSYHSETLGNYYNFYAATAGRSATLAAGESTDSSICPKGWRLPNGGDDVSINETANLFSKYGATSVENNETLVNNYNSIIMGSPLSYNMGGYYVKDGSSWTISGTGSYGFYWQATRYNDDRAYTLYFIRKFSFKPMAQHSMASGDLVRCIAE